jgi:hypothetical protein
MASFPRLILQFAAAAGIAAMLSTAAPAVAAESVLTVEPAAKTAPSMIKRHASRVLTAARRDRRVSGIRSDLGCLGIWCGREFVLMIGVAY